MFIKSKGGVTMAKKARKAKKGRKKVRRVRRRKAVARII